MKKLYILIVRFTISCSLFIVNSYAQAPYFAWAKSAGGSGSDCGYSICVDANGNSFITGYFENRTITFDPITLINKDNTGNTADIFISKYDPMGNVVWAKSTGGNSSGQSISIDYSKNYYITGYFRSPTIIFGSTTLADSDSTSSIFIAKFASTNCSAYFIVTPDTTTLHHYYIINNASGITPIKYYWSWGDGTYDTIAYPSHTYSTA